MERKFVVLLGALTLIWAFYVPAIADDETPPPPNQPRQLCMEGPSGEKVTVHYPAPSGSVTGKGTSAARAIRDAKRLAKAAAHLSAAPCDKCGPYNGECSNGADYTWENEQVSTPVWDEEIQLWVCTLTWDAGTVMQWCDPCPW